MTGFSDLEALARTVYGEARGETYEGKKAVAHVVLNRLKHRPTYGVNIWEICHKPWAFSCWNENDPNLPIIKAASVELLGDSICAALDVLNGLSDDPTHGATHYLTTMLLNSNPPSWAKDKPVLAVIGNHSFLSPDF